MLTKHTCDITLRLQGRYYMLYHYNGSQLIYMERFQEEEQAVKAFEVRKCLQDIMEKLNG